MNDCPIAMSIPIYLVVSGAILTCISLTCMIVLMSTGKSDTAASAACTACTACNCAAFAAFCFFAGKSSLMMRRISKTEPDIAIF